MTHVIATSRSWYEQLPAQLLEKIGEHFFLISNKEELTVARLRELKPRYVFFPHWSHMIPAEIYDNFECVIFHMTDLPFGRGGSPLQNLITRGIYETKISALRCTAGIDAGPIYMKEPLTLHGTAEEIYLRAAKIIGEMIALIVKNEPTPAPQTGQVVSFDRRKERDGNIAGLSDLEQAFDYIRMLDADGYPRAFIETEHFKFEFQRASLKQGKIISDVIITKKKGKHE